MGSWTSIDGSFIGSLPCHAQAQLVLCLAQLVLCLARHSPLAEELCPSWLIDGPCPAIVLCGLRRGPWTDTTVDHL